MKGRKNRPEEQAFPFLGLPSFLPSFLPGEDPAVAFRYGLTIGFPHLWDCESCKPYGRDVRVRRLKRSLQTIASSSLVLFGSQRGVCTIGADECIWIPSPLRVKFLASGITPHPENEHSTHPGTGTWPSKNCDMLGLPNITVTHVFGEQTPSLQLSPLSSPFQHQATPGLHSPNWAIRVSSTFPEPWMIHPRAYRPRGPALTPVRPGGCSLTSTVAARRRPPRVPRRRRLSRSGDGGSLWARRE